eukprot:3271805-Amphidinium_carterae.1
MITESSLNWNAKARQKTKSSELLIEILAALEHESNNHKMIAGRFKVQCQAKPLLTPFIGWMRAGTKRLSHVGTQAY